MLELGDEKAHEQEQAALKQYIPLRLGAKSVHDIVKALAGPSKSSSGGNRFIRAWGKKTKQAEGKARPKVALLATAKVVAALEKPKPAGVEGELASLKKEVQQNHRCRRTARSRGSPRLTQARIGSGIGARSRGGTGSAGRR